MNCEGVYRYTFDEALIGIAQSDLGGRFVMVNRYLCQLLGYAPDELVGANFMSITHPDDVESDLEARAGLIAGAVDRYVREKRYRRRDGSYVWVKLMASVHRDAAGAPSYFVAIVEDISERRRAAQEREHLESQLRQMHKMDAIGRLAGGVAHDFNNLLTVIIGFTDLLLSDVPADGALRRDLQEIRKAGESASALTHQLLAFSRKQILKPQILDLNAVVTRASTMLRRLIGEHIRLELHLAAPLDRVSADPGQIEQVILNLALNARDAMPRGGTLSVETVNVAGDLHDHPAARGPSVLLAVRDTGVGMPDEVREHVFEPFYSTKEPGQGTGLGLATVYGIVNQSGGSIEIDSAPGCGTTVRVFLPRVEQTLELAVAPPDPAPAVGGTGTLLLVEDDEHVRAVTYEILTRSGYTVIAAANGSEALALASSYRGRIDLLLTDVVMPGPSAGDLTRGFARACPGTPVLYMSGHVDDSVASRDILTGDAALIQKPFTPFTLLRRVDEMLRGRDAS